MIESTEEHAPPKSLADEPAIAARRAKTAQRLLPAVEKLLESASFRELSIDQIVDEGEISRSTFYHYFEDRADLLRALTMDVMGSILHATESWWALPADASPAEVKAALHHLVTAYGAHAALMVAVGESVPHDPLLREAFMSFMQRGMLEMERYIRGGQDAGVMSTELDAPATAHWLTWMFERGLARLGRADSGYEGDRVLDALVDLVMRALRT